MRSPRLGLACLLAPACLLALLALPSLGRAQAAAPEGAVKAAERAPPLPAAESETRAPAEAPRVETPAPAPAPVRTAPASGHPITDTEVLAATTGRWSYFEAPTDHEANTQKDDQGRLHLPMLHLPGELQVTLSSDGIERLTIRAREKGKRLTDVGLILNGVFLKGTHPRIYQRAKDPNDHLFYTVAYSAKDGPVLNQLLLEQGFRGINVSLGFDDGEAMLSNCTIDILPQLRDLLGASFFGVLLLLLFYLVATRTTMLLDPGHGFSLGRTQMAWWTLLTVWGFTFIYRFTGSLSITQSVVILMGISSATALAAVFIDQKKAETPAGTESKPPPPAFGAHHIPFFRSLLTDPSDPAGGLSLNRAQVVVWTLIMSWVFLDSVIGRFLMPDFDNTLLALMGVSSGTYIGFKLPEKSSAAAAPAKTQ